jgi:hypothetical protein
MPSFGGYGDDAQQGEPYSAHDGEQRRVAAISLVIGQTDEERLWALQDDLESCSKARSWHISF